MNIFQIATLALAFFVLLVLLKFIFVLSEYKYSLITSKPFYVHFYFRINKLSFTQIKILEEKFQFYNSLSDRHKKYFEHRVATFIESYEFIGKDGFEVTDEVKVLIASTGVMLTFGMRNYLFDVLDTIIIYPSQYYSSINQNYHKGEFNPHLKAVVFSWEDFELGYKINDDNLNLGIHEFCHVLHFNARRNENVSDIMFLKTFEEIQNDLEISSNRERLIQSDYFRVYAYTNQYEFLAVIIEHFFESPQIFKQEFSKLFDKVSIMLNYSH